MGEGMAFEHRTMAQRVLFGSGTAAAHLREEVRSRGARRVMAIVTPSAAHTARSLLDGVDVVAWFDGAALHVPVETAERARAVAGASGADLLVCVGGGSAIGVAKAVALTASLPIVAVPTTYSGSEATPLWGLTEGGRKTTGTDDRVLPATVIYDADLTLSLPVELSVASGLNALAHCVDSLWAPRANPITTGLAVEGVRLLAAGLPIVRREPADRRGRELILCGAHLAGVAFAGAGSGIHHTTCHVLGGRFGLPHAQTHAVLLPHVLAFNAPAAPWAAHRLAEALQADDGVAGLAALHRDLGAPRSLGDLGLREEDLREAADLALARVPPSNPRAVDAASLLALLRAAWAGKEPGVQVS